MKQHIESVHEEKRVFTSNICDAAFSHNGHIIRHIIKSIHDERRTIKLDQSNAWTVKIGEGSGPRSRTPGSSTGNRAPLPKSKWCSLAGKINPIFKEHHR